MKKLIYTVMFILMCNVCNAATTSTNGYFYLPDVGDTGTAIHTAWVAVQEATDGVIKGLVTAVGLNTTHRTSTGADHSYIDQSVVSGATPTFTGTNITAAATATALVANGANCSAGQYPLGVDASGAVESCTALVTESTTAGRSLTMSTYSVEADAELYTDSIGFVLETPADADAFILFKAPHAITITDVDCIVGAATSAVIDILECDSAGANCATIDSSGPITCDADGAADDASLSNGGIDAGDWIKLDIGTVTGTVGYVSGTVTFTRND